MIDGLAHGPPCHTSRGGGNAPHLPQAARLSCPLEREFSGDFRYADGAGGSRLGDLCPYRFSPSACLGHAVLPGPDLGAVPAGGGAGGPDEQKAHLSPGPKHECPFHPGPGVDSGDGTGVPRSLSGLWRAQWLRACPVHARAPGHDSRARGRGAHLQRHVPVLGEHEPFPRARSGVSWCPLGLPRGRGGGGREPGQRQSGFPAYRGALCPGSPGHPACALRTASRRQARSRSGRGNRPGAALCACRSGAPGADADRTALFNAGYAHAVPHAGF